MLELVHSFQTPETTRALAVVIVRGQGLELDALRQLAFGEALPLVVHLFTTFEALGALVYRGELDLDLVRAVFGGPVTRSWSVLRPLVEELRQQRGWPRYSEWFQWLAERIQELDASAPQEPAYVAFCGRTGAARRKPR